MPFDPTVSLLADTFTGAVVPVIKHVTFLPGNSSAANPIHVQYVRATQQGHGVRVVEECGQGVTRSVLAYFGASDIIPDPRHDPGRPGARQLRPTGWRAVVMDFARATTGGDKYVTLAHPLTGVMVRLPGAGPSDWSLLHEAINALRPLPTVTELPGPVELRASHVVRPPFKLVQLTNFPATAWIGRPVFCPCEQRGDVPTWVDTDDNEPVDASADGPPGPHPAYDVGVVTRYDPDPDFADLGHVRVWFVGSRGSMLHYTAWNLWTPVEMP